jgi:hypothetical protein
MFLDIYDKVGLFARVGGKNGIDYMYQIEQYVIDTTDENGTDGPPVRWDLIEGTADNSGQIIRQWFRYPNGSVHDFSPQPDLTATPESPP